MSMRRSARRSNVAAIIALVLVTALASAPSILTALHQGGGSVLSSTAPALVLVSDNSPAR
jgi:hypothetical protein